MCGLWVLQPGERGDAGDVDGRSGDPPRDDEVEAIERMVEFKLSPALGSVTPSFLAYHCSCLFSSRACVWRKNSLFCVSYQFMGDPPAAPPRP